MANTTVQSSPTIVNETIQTNSQNNTQTLFNINISNVIKLTSTNYLMWSLQIHALLDGYDLAGYLDGSITIPSATITTNDVITVNP